MEIAGNFSELKAAIKAGENDILMLGCSKRLMCAFAAARVCLAMGITSVAGVIASSGAIAMASAPATGGVSTLLIIVSAVTIISIVAICRDYDIELEWQFKTVHVRLKREKNVAL